MNNLLDILNKSVNYLEKKKIENSRITVEKIFSEILDMQRIMLYANFEKILSEKEMEKIIKNLEKLQNRDFEFINAGRIVVASESRNIDIDIINEVCNRLKIETNHITKNDLKKIIEEIKIELDYLLDYLEPEIPKLKRN